MIFEGRLWDWDRELLLALNGSWGAGWDTFWWTVSQAWAWSPLIVFAIGWMWWRLGWRRMLAAVVLVIIGITLADQIAGLFKTYTPKFRPSRTPLLWDGVAFSELVDVVRDPFSGDVYRGGTSGTVSGHAATSMAVAVTLAGICRRWWMSLLLAFYVLATCFSRIYLGVHYPMDIVFGLTLGTIVGLSMFGIWRLIIYKFRNLRI